MSLFSSIGKGLTSVWKAHVGAAKIGLSAVFPGAGQYMAAQDANEANRKMQEEANRANVALWERQTAYNTPAAQMQRLEAAGLNPNLVYGQVADSKMAAAPTMVAPEARPAEFRQGALEALASYQQVMNLHALNAKQRAETAATALDTQMKRYEYETLKSRGQTRYDSGMLKDILGGLDLLTRFGSMVRDRSSSDFVHLKTDQR